MVHWILVKYIINTTIRYWILVKYLTNYTTMRYCFLRVKYRFYNFTMMRYWILVKYLTNFKTMWYSIQVKYLIKSKTTILQVWDIGYKSNISHFQKYKKRAWPFTNIYIQITNEFNANLIFHFYWKVTLFWTHGCKPIRPERWSIFQSDGMVNVFFQATIDFNGFSMVLKMLHHHHWMFSEGPTIAVNGFSMVFKIFRGNGQRWFGCPIEPKK